MKTNKLKTPLISIGLPVFNGENGLRQALLSILEQTVKDLEIIISDNCSTDKTAEICREFAIGDNRITYFRQASNIGAGPNYNFVFDKSVGKYFKWAAHDDFMDADALESCVAALEKEPQAVLAHPLIVDVDADGRQIAVADRGIHGETPAHQRFWTLIEGDHNCGEIFGVIRSSVLRKTRLIRDYSDSDRTLLGELALKGKIIQLSSTRFYRRIHPGKSDRIYRNYWERSVWFNPKLEGKFVAAGFLQLFDWLRAILVSPLSVGEKIRCFYWLARRVKWQWRLYALEIQLFIAEATRFQLGARKSTLMKRNDFFE